ncbi:ABC transporter ATP-binding protein/permease [Actinomadura madurae]|nr:ABC transporter ATP-binding protein [Actinomadura madurae]URN07180.1 ABC transporter ATP-binding protein/permease [Actinomadura madurae]
MGARDLVAHLRGQGPTLGVACGLSPVIAAATLAQPLLIRSLVDATAAGRSVGLWTAAIVVALTVLAVLTALRDYLLRRAGEALVLRIRTRLAAHLLRLPVAEYDRRRTGDLLSRASADSTLLRNVVTSGLFSLVTGGMMVVGAAVALMAVDVILFGVTLGGLALGLAAVVTIAKRTRSLSQEAQSRLGEMTSALSRALSAVRTIRAARAESRESRAIETDARRGYAAGLRLARAEALVGPASVLTLQGTFLVVLAAGGTRVAGGDLSVGDLVAFVLLVFFLVTPLGEVFRAYSELQAGMGALQRIEEILRLPREDVWHGPGPTAAKPALSVGEPVPAIVFDGVTFGYGDRPAALRDVGFVVPAGSRTALVGPSGAGKSTVLTLVERFYDVGAGAVYVEGTDVRRWTSDRLRARLGYVEQEAPVLAGTIRENLLLAAPHAGESELLAVLEAVDLTHVVERSPRGLDSPVGENGVRLSGGSANASASPGRFWPTRPSCSWTSPPATSTPATRPSSIVPSRPPAPVTRC